ncbi:MAG: carbonic anhydrase, partial [Dyella sp.]|nr:carbonic anhydrase [Dyella sp.]
MDLYEETCCATVHIGRRTMLKSTLGLMALGAMGVTPLLVPGLADAAALTKAQRDAMTPDQVIALLKQGNERFRA